MRVIAGTLKGRRLAGPRWKGLRPTSDRLRGTLFEILGPRTEGARVLDGYAGTGAIGIEALSRGARHVTFVERDRRATALIARNLAVCGVTDGYTMMPTTLETAGGRFARWGFELILLDPPYGELGTGFLLEQAGEWLVPDGLLVLEHGSREIAPARAGGLVRIRRVVAGDSALSFYAHGRSGVETR